jgi:hypothetical protein
MLFTQPLTVVRSPVALNPRATRFTLESRSDPARVTRRLAGPSSFPSSLRGILATTLETVTGIPEGIKLSTAISFDGEILTAACVLLITRFLMTATEAKAAAARMQIKRIRTPGFKRRKSDISTPWAG